LTEGVLLTQLSSKAESQFDESCELRKLFFYYNTSFVQVRFRFTRQLGSKTPFYYI